MLEMLIEKFGKDFTWFEPSNKLVFENQLFKELIPEHPLYGKKLYVVAKSERNGNQRLSPLSKNQSRKYCFIFGRELFEWHKFRR